MPTLSQSRSRRIQARNHTTRIVTTITNESIHALNELYYNYQQPLQNRITTHTKLQQRLTAHVYRAALRFNTRRRVHALNNGANAVCDDSIANLINSDSKSLHLLSAGYSHTVSAVPLIADRVALPDIAGQCDLLGTLPPDIATSYKDANSGSLRPHDERVTTVKPHVYAIHTEYIKLIKRMMERKMVEFTQTPFVINGLFGVDKPDGYIRLIIDGRPANEIFIKSPKVELPGPDLLPKLIVPDGKKLYVAKSDLSDFFYRFRIPQWMQPYFALPGIKAEELQLESKYGIGTLIYPCLAVLAMGWSHSVYLAQKAHEHLLNTSTRLQPQDRITATNDLRIDRIRHMVYIDDVLMFGTDQVLMKQVQDEYIQTAKIRNLPAKPAKVKAPTDEGVDCLGFEIVGRDCTLSPRADKLDKLRMDTASLLRRGCCTGRELAEIVGRWTWVMLIARPALSCFSSVYRFIQCARTKTYQLWNSVCRELYLAASLAPLFVTTLSSSWYRDAIATDASMSGQGVVAATLSQSLVERAARNSGSIAPKTVDTILLDMEVTNHNFTTLVSAPWHEEEHINRLELRSISTAIRRVLSSPNSIRRRLLLLSDSQVAVGALAKGRSSSHGLLCRLRPLSALILSSGMQLFLRWIPSYLNPADEPSRRFGT